MHNADHPTFLFSAMNGARLMTPDPLASLARELTAAAEPQAQDDAAAAIAAAHGRAAEMASADIPALYLIPAFPFPGRAGTAANIPNGRRRGK